ncbi:MAG TPA: hypothetical protein IAD28_05040, partial [Candidatus Faeciplasma avium]|nr:hypothetical protein [Candidatus Faeciplasma avium]
TEATTAPPATTTPELETTLPPSDTIVSENAIEESGLPGEDSAAVLDSLDAENAQNQPQSDNQQGDNLDGVDALADSAQASSPIVFILILAAAGVIVFVVISYILRNRS